MIRILLILLGVLLHTTLCGQYTYFNSHLGPLGGVEAGNGITSQLMISNDSIVNVTMYPNSGDYTLSFNILNMEGEFIHHVHNSTGDGYVLLNYGDALTPYHNGYLYAGVHSSGVTPYISYFDAGFEQEWEKQVPVYFDENEEPVFYSSEIYGQFHFAKPLNDGGFMVAGPKTYNFDPDDYYQKLWIQRYNVDHELVWDKEYPFYSEEIIPESKRFLRVNDLIELANGDLLVSGCWYHSWMPMALRFDSEGNFISSASWGATGPLQTINDWLPWPVQIDEENFLFAYKHGTIYQDLTVQYGKPRIGHLDASTMEVTLFDPIEREAKHHWLTDFIAATDSGFVALGYGVRPDPEDPDMNIEFSYLLKVNPDGEEIWYHEYLPPVDHINPWVYDLEVTPNGGYAFVGNFRLVEDGEVTNEQRQWVVKTDACGELQYNGCEAVVTSNSIPSFKNQPLQIWPNPTVGELNIKLSSSNARQLVIRDIRGVVVMQQEISTEQTLSISTHTLFNGLYLVQLVDANGNVCAQERMVKQ